MAYIWLMTFPTSTTPQVITGLLLYYLQKWGRCYPHVSYIQGKQRTCPRSQKKTEANPRFAYRFPKHQIAQHFNKSIHQLLLCFSFCENSYTGRTKQNILATSHEISTVWTLRRESDSRSITHNGMETLDSCKNLRQCEIKPLWPKEKQIHEKNQRIISVLHETELPSASKRRTCRNLTGPVSVSTQL